MTNKIDLSRADKIFTTMYKMGNGKAVPLKFEDIVVEIFKAYPDNFHLRGYFDYPDSGDLVHKPLYDFRKKGLVSANNKVFTLTEKGLIRAQKLVSEVSGKLVISSNRLSRFVEKETLRIEKTEGFNLFLQEEEHKITDTDFYNYLGVSSRSTKNDFIGRMKTLKDAVKELADAKNVSAIRNEIPRYHKFLVNKFSNIIDHFNNK